MVTLKLNLKEEEDGREERKCGDIHGQDDKKGAQKNMLSSKKENEREKDGNGKEE